MPEPSMSAGGNHTRSRDLFRGIFRAARGAVEIVLRTDRQRRGRYPLQLPTGVGVVTRASFLSPPALRFTGKISRMTLTPRCRSAGLAEEVVMGRLIVALTMDTAALEPHGFS